MNKLSTSMLLSFQAHHTLFKRKSRHPVLDTGSILKTNAEFPAWIPYQVRDDGYGIGSSSIKTRTILLTCTCLLLTACGGMAERLENVGKPPALTTMQNPVQQAGYQPITQPQPTPVPNIRNPNSLWQPGSRSFFKDLRAHDVGDLLTVVVSIKDAAKIDNTTTRARDNKEKGGFTGLFGLENQVAQILPGAPQSDELVGLSNTTNNKGTGKIDRAEEINVRVAATVVQKLPNNNLVVSGKQEVRVNNELRELTVSGIIRPQDIMADNTITSDKMAEARVSYGGRGQITDVQQPRYGQQVLDVILPF